MALPLKIDPLDTLPRTPASDVKKLGWRGVMKAVARSGKVVVTHHNEPEAVILSPEEYAGIRRALQAAADATEPSLDSLRRHFDARLAVLQAADAGDRLRAVMDAPAHLGGEVKAGASH
jgi:prevent-host-death family protein